MKQLQNSYIKCWVSLRSLEQRSFILIHIPNILLFSQPLQETLVGSVSPSCPRPSLWKAPSHNPSTIHWKAQDLHQILANTKSYSLSSQMLQWQSHSKPSETRFAEETKRLQIGLQMQLLRRAIAKSCKGLQAKHRYVLAAWLKSAGLWQPIGPSQNFERYLLWWGFFIPAAGS